MDEEPMFETNSGTTALALFVILMAMIALVSVSGCNNHDHPNRSARADVGDLNYDGLVDERDIDILADIVFGDQEQPEISDPYFERCDVVFDWRITIEDLTDLEDRVRQRHHEDDDDDDDYDE